MITLKQLKKLYSLKRVVVVTDKERAKNLLNNIKMSCCWNNGKIDNTGWTLLSRFSPLEKNDKPVFLICKNKLIDI